ncbi:peroxiredoxin [Pelagibacterium flavum]|uniref:thioredoxin-dependent peroxiredoxin n=1 Tax=Pelagibacterium flavum TaxID=2984530 RepID=A0ABY6IIL4_9HYPH|nr:peroxiredoxin [Pelagibacterium sp. YIM 151497]UYQ70423.1 peroxiredoxin [Pelagibacterium sp. YIM 151497]|tara:strand:+ start:180 stop:659 length:480 start_codon:yes stop_codon:yes gene_type:complete
MEKALLMTIPAVGKSAPDFTLQTDAGEPFTLSDQRGRSVLIYFYPQADTPACNDQNLAFTANAKWFAERDIVLVGISPDSVEKLSNFRQKYALSPILLSDPDHKAIGPYGVWGEKKNYGRTYEGLIRSTVLIDPEGRIAQVWPNIRAKGHVERVMKAIG